MTGAMVVGACQGLCNSEILTLARLLLHFLARFQALPSTPVRVLPPALIQLLSQAPVQLLARTLVQFLLSQTLVSVP